VRTGADRTREPEELSERRRSGAGQPVQRPETADILGLQRMAGNRAVTGLLTNVGAGPAGTVTVSRDDITTTTISETTDTGNRYTQALVLNKTSPSIRIELGITWSKAGTWASNEAYQAFIRTVKTSAYSYLDGKFKVVCTPTAPGAGPAPVELPITFLLYDWNDGYPITAHGGTPGGDSAMAQAGGNVYEYADATTLEEPITFAHEFGHAVLGASDEYANPSVPGRVLTNDHSIMANYYAQGKAQAQFKARHFQHIVTEVATAFAGYSCGLRSM
jgi:hypothetical protein